MLNKPFGGGVATAEVPPSLTGGLNTDNTLAGFTGSSLAVVLAAPVKWSAAIDYLTMTQSSTRLTNPETGEITDGDNRVAWEQLRQKWLAYLSTDERGSPVTPKFWSSHGYEGFQYGDHVVFAYNLSTDSVLVRASGAMAHNVFVEFAPLATNCSRIDFQLTVWLRHRVSTLAIRQYVNLLRTRKANLFSSPGRVCRDFGLRLDGNFGSTLYVGSRSSRAFGRLYDKSRDPKLQNLEKERYARSWRYELELKDEYSSGILDQYKAQVLADAGYVLAADQIARIVIDWFARQGVMVPQLGALSESNYVLSQFRRTGSDIWRKLKWLQTQVAPTVEYLIEIGFKVDAFLSLGLAFAKVLDEVGYEYRKRESGAGYYMARPPGFLQDAI